MRGAAWKRGSCIGIGNVAARRGAYRGDKAPNLRRNQMAIQEFEVRCSGDGNAAEVNIALGFLTQAKSICADEIGLIDAEIVNHRIPFPKAIPRERQRVDFTAKLRRCTDAVLKAPGDERGKMKRNGNTQRWQRFIPKKFLFFLSWIHVSRLSGSILKCARSGPITIVGMGTDPLVLAKNLRRNGREAVVVTPGNGVGPVISPGYLERPVKGSLINWLLEDQKNLEEAGAVIFLGKDEFSLDVDALGAADDQPPLLFTSSKWWRQEIISAHRNGLPQTELAEIGMRLPCISIVIVSFNQAAFLEAAIRSVIDQNFPNLDLIIVDGGSTDGSVEIIERYRAHCTHVVIEPDQGQSDALNKGFALASGDILNWLCSDDMLEPEALRRVAKAYVSTGADLIVGGCVRFGKTRSDEMYRHHTSVVVGQNTRFEALDVLRFMGSWQKANYFFQPELFFTRRIWRASGGFIKNHLYYMMDYDLWFRMALAGASIYHIPFFLGCSRVHAEQKTRDSKEYMYQARWLLEEYQDLFCALEAACESSDERPASEFKIGGRSRFEVNG